jgi:hypothetical protein
MSKSNIIIQNGVITSSSYGEEKPGGAPEFKPPIMKKADIIKTKTKPLLKGEWIDDLDFIGRDYGSSPFQENWFTRLPFILFAIIYIILFLFFIF